MEQDVAKIGSNKFRLYSKETQYKKVQVNCKTYIIRYKIWTTLHLFTSDILILLYLILYNHLTLKIFLKKDVFYSIFVILKNKRLVYYKNNMEFKNKLQTYNYYIFFTIYKT